MAHESRLKILCILRDGEYSVTSLEHGAIELRYTARPRDLRPGGTVAGQLRLNERLYDIRVFSRPSVDVAGLPNVRILTPAGARDTGFVPAGAFTSRSNLVPLERLHGPQRSRAGRVRPGS